MGYFVMVYDSDESDNDAALWDGAEIAEISQRQAAMIDDVLLIRA